MKKFIVFLSLAINIGCNQIYTPLSEDGEGDERIPVARANNTYLYKNDVIGIVPKDATSKDSSLLMSKYIDSWIKKQLMIQQASQELEYDEANIERKVLDYRYALMVHEFEKYYIDQHLEKKISEEEINAYYEEKSENFVLRQNIIRCLFAIVPVEAPQIDDFRIMVRSYPDSDIEEIKSYCYRFASNSSIESDLWLNFDEVIANTPVENIQDKATFLKNNSFMEMSDENNYYFIRLLDYKISDQVSPLTYIRDDIENILINKKKIDIRKRLEDNILNSARENNDFEIYQ